jgi:ABC-type nitrate/sulfonate/bicarbonate transport system substrate-binding protein
MVAAPPPPLYCSQETAGDLVMLAASAQGGIFSIEAMPGVNSITDLKGKTAAVTSAGSTTDLLLRQVLQQNKLVPTQDVGITVIADNMATIAALTSHQVAAIVTGEPFTSIAVSQGAHVIYDQAKSGESAVQTPVTVKRSYIAGHRDILKRLLMANLEAIHMMKTDPAASARYIQPYLKVDDLSALQASVESSAKVIAPDMNIPMDYLAKPKDCGCQRSRSSNPKAGRPGRCLAPPRDQSQRLHRQALPVVRSGLATNSPE